MREKAKEGLAIGREMVKETKDAVLKKQSGGRDKMRDKTGLGIKVQADCLLARLLNVVYIVLAIFDVFFQKKP